MNRGAQKPLRARMHRDVDGGSDGSDEDEGEDYAEVDDYDDQPSGYSGQGAYPNGIAN